MSKERIAHALAKENIKEVHFYNAGGAQGLYKDNDYFAGKTATLTKLKQWELLPRHVVDISSQYLNVEKKPLIERFKVISDENKKKAFYIKAKGEGQFSVYPAKDYLNAYFTALKNPNRVERSKMLTTLAQRYYAVAQAHPEVKKELIMPKLPKNVDMSKLVKATINRNGEKDNYKYFVWATISGTHHKKEITENGAQVFHHMFLADDMQAYKNAVAANVFESLISPNFQLNCSDNLLRLVFLWPSSFSPYLFRLVSRFTPCWDVKSKSLRNLYLLPDKRCYLGGMSLPFDTSYIPHLVKHVQRRGEHAVKASCLPGMSDI